jgi:hypothetical protein
MKKKICQFLSIAVLIATAFYLPAENASAASGDVWYKVFSRPFYSNYGDREVLGMAEFGGTVYAAVGRGAAPYSANIYRLESEACKLWDCFTPLWACDIRVDEMPMEVFKSKLYVGTAQGEVWRTDGLKWMNWENVTGNWFDASVDDMAVFNVMGADHLYIIADGIRCTSDGTSWGKPVNLPDPKIHDVESLEVFDGYLYAGAGLSFKKGAEDWKGIQLWRTKNGKDWSLFKEVEAPMLAAFSVPEHVHALKAFNGYLYVGEYHGQGLYRTDGKKSMQVCMYPCMEYIDTKVVKGGGVYRLVEHDNTLYLGMNDWFETDDYLGDYLLYSSPDGKQWSAGTGYPVVDSDSQAVGCLLSYGKKLYVGLEGRPFTDGTLEICALGPAPAPSCAIKAVNKSVVNAVLKISGIVTAIHEHTPHLPDLRVLPPIGPRPPPPNGDELPEWEFTLVRNMISAVEGIEVPPEVEEIKELVIANLDLVDAEVGLAMSILVEAASDYDGEAVEVRDHSDVIDEVLAHLENALVLCEEASSLLSLMYEKPTSVYVDIKPGSCPNPLNKKSEGLLPVAILGTKDFDVTAIDPSSIKLSRDPVSCFAEPIRWSYEDVATPFDGERCDCHDHDGDGYLDLTLKFDIQELVSCLALESLVAGQPVPLTLTGNLTEEHSNTPIEGQDCILILK